jgi:hypothetical protein
MARSCIVALSLAATSALGLAAGCDRSESAPRRAIATSTSATPRVQRAAPAVSSLAPSPPKAPDRPAERVLLAWNAALDARDADKLAPLYAPRVIFYGIPKAAKDVLRAKRTAFAKAPDFRQSLDNVRITSAPNGFEVRFDKRSGSGKGSVVPARLFLEAKGDRLLIAEESDAITDERLNEPEPANCGDAALGALNKHPDVVREFERVAREYPELTTGGVTYEETDHSVNAALGVFHPDHFEPYFWIEAVNGQLTVQSAVTTEPLRFSKAELTRVRKACSGTDQADSGPDASPR